MARVVVRIVARVVVRIVARVVVVVSVEACVDVDLCAEVERRWETCCGVPAGADFNGVDSED